MDVLRLKGLEGRQVGLLSLFQVEGLGGGQGNNIWWETDVERAKGFYDKCKHTLKSATSYINVV